MPGGPGRDNIALSRLNRLAVVSRHARASRHSASVNTDELDPSFRWGDAGMEIRVQRKPEPLSI